VMIVDAAAAAAAAVIVSTININEFDRIIIIMGMLSFCFYCGFFILNSRIAFINVFAISESRKKGKKKNAKGRLLLLRQE
jgi:hypothetical protein